MGNEIWSVARGLTPHFKNTKGNGVKKERVRAKKVGKEKRKGGEPTPVRSIEES